MRGAIICIVSIFWLGLFLLVGNTSFGYSVDDVVKELLPMADIYESKGCYRKAIELYEKLLQHYPETTFLPVIKFRMARNYHLQGKYDEAFKIYKELTKVLPKDVSSALISMGDELMRKGRYRKAIDVYTFWRSEYPTDECVPTTTLKLAQCYEHLYQWKEAVSLLETTITNYPQHTLVPRLFEELRYIWQESYRERAYNYQSGSLFRETFVIYLVEGIISDIGEAIAFIMGYSARPFLPQVPLPKEDVSKKK